MLTKAMLTAILVASLLSNSSMQAAPQEIAESASLQLANPKERNFFSDAMTRSSFVEKTFDFLTEQDLTNLALVQKGMAPYIEAYRKRYVDKLLTQLNQLDATLSAGECSQAAATLKNATLKAYFLLELEKKMHASGLLFVPQGSALVPFLEAQFTRVSTDDFLLAADQAAKLYAAYFKSAFPEEERERARALEHLQAVWPLAGVYKRYGTATAKATLEEFFKQAGAVVTALNLQPDYVSMGQNDAASESSQALQAGACHLVLSDTQLNAPIIKDKLQRLLAANPQHIVILSVGDNHNIVNAQGVLRLTKEQLPAVIKHLRIVNPRGNVKAIGDAFLDVCSGLTTFDTAGLGQVTSIGDNFLFRCTGLTAFDTAGLGQVRSIGDCFLYGCTGLTTVDTPGLGRVRSIGGNFLAWCSGLTTFNPTGLGQVTSIGSGFLHNCRGLSSVNRQNIDAFVRQCRR